MMDLNKLNPYQKEAVLDESPACLVNANVGSGKTTVLTAKVRYLCEQKGVAPKDLMVLTFTNKAANEIRERLENLTGKEEDLWFGTFHSVALRMLQTILPVEELGYTKEFQVCIPEEEMQMAQQLITEQNLQIKYKNRLKKRLDQSRQKSGRKPKDYGDDFERLCTLLEEEKKKQNKMTYEELILHTGQLLQSHPEILRPLWLIIDEVQDCDQSQLDLLDSLMGKDSHLFAVGDPNQVIYSWRGSAFQIFFQLKNRYQAMELSLPINYRSSGTILSAARRFLQNGSTLEGVKSEGGKVQIRKQYDPFQEAEDLAGDSVSRDWDFVSFAESVGTTGTGTYQKRDSGACGSERKNERYSGSAVVFSCASVLRESFGYHEWCGSVVQQNVWRGMDNEKSITADPTLGDGWNIAEKFSIVFGDGECSGRCVCDRRNRSIVGNVLTGSLSDAI